jgi:hypothetical protein
VFCIDVLSSAGRCKVQVVADAPHSGPMPDSALDTLLCGPTPLALGACKGRVLARDLAARLLALDHDADNVERCASNERVELLGGAVLATCIPVPGSVSCDWLLSVDGRPELVVCGARCHRSPPPPLARAWLLTCPCLAQAATAPPRPPALSSASATLVSIPDALPHGLCAALHIPDARCGALPRWCAEAKTLLDGAQCLSGAKLLKAKSTEVVLVLESELCLIPGANSMARVQVFGQEDWGGFPWWSAQDVQRALAHAKPDLVALGPMVGGDLRLACPSEALHLQQATVILKPRVLEQAMAALSSSSLSVVQGNRLVGPDATVTLLSTKRVRIEAASADVRHMLASKFR